MELVVRVEQDDNEHNVEATFCGGVTCAGLEMAHDENDSLFFALDCGNEEDFDS